MNNPVEIEEFLKYYARIYKQNPNLPIVRDTIYLRVSNLWNK